jgi:hypothetical protein
MQSQRLTHRHTDSHKGLYIGTPQSQTLTHRNIHTEPRLPREAKDRAGRTSRGREKMGRGRW